MCLLMISIATFFHCKAWRSAKKPAAPADDPERSTGPPPPPSPMRRCSRIPLLLPDQADWASSAPPPFLAAANQSRLSSSPVTGSPSLLPSSTPWILSSSPPSTSLPASSPPTLLRAPSAPPSVPATRVRNNLAFLLEVLDKFSTSIPWIYPFRSSVNMYQLCIKAPSVCDLLDFPNYAIKGQRSFLDIKGLLNSCRYKTIYQTMKIQTVWSFLCIVYPSNRCGVSSMCHFTSFAARQNLLSPSFPLVVVSDGPPIVFHVLGWFPKFCVPNPYLWCPGIMNKSLPWYQKCSVFSQPLPHFNVKTELSFGFAIVGQFTPMLGNQWFDHIM